MAVSKKPRGRFWSWLHFVFRFIGLTGRLLAGVGLVLAHVEGAIPWDEVRARLAWDRLPELFDADTLNRAGAWVQDLFIILRTDGLDRWGQRLLVLGGAGLLVGLLIELLVSLGMLFGRRSAFGFNAVLQAALAAVLLAGVNYYSFYHYQRYDWTRGGQFTLPESVREQLADLRGETTIVVYQRHQTFGRLSDKPDAYDYAAERKVVEKVRDLVAQFRELGPQFRVVALDVEEEGYDKKLDETTKDAPELRAAIEQAPENSIFFSARAADGRPAVQRLSFNEFYQLDKTASQERGNLVLLKQGVEPFARKALNIDERKPRVAIGVIHDLLSTEGSGDYSLRGVKKALEAHGFETRDVILKKSRGFSLLGPGVYTFAESRYDRLDNEIKSLEVTVKNIASTVQRNEEVRKEFQTATLKELTDKYSRRLRVREIDEEIRRFQLEGLAEVIAAQKEDLEHYRERLKERVAERDGLNVESAAELARMADLEAKFDRLLADCDLLVLPRMTFRNLALNDVIVNEIYRLDEAQVASIKKFLRKGKPVLACFGPDLAPPDRRGPPPEGPDGVEKLLADLGIHFGKTVVLYDAEAPLTVGRFGQVQILGADAEVPPVEFGADAADAWPPRRERPKPNPVRAAMRLAARSVGKSLDLQARHPRPVYFDPADGKQPAVAAEIMVTSAAAWNEPRPFPGDEEEARVLRFEEPKSDDPARGTRDEKRKGRFTLGVAVETTVPASWYGEAAEVTPGAAAGTVGLLGSPAGPALAAAALAPAGPSKVKPATVRVAALGHGGLFVGPEVSPAKEQLLLNTCNWLLGRDDRLPRGDDEWQYPRVSLAERDRQLWLWGTRLGLPALFLYVGVVVLMMRRLR